MAVLLRQTCQKLDVALLVLRNTFDGDVFDRTRYLQLQTACHLTDNGGQSRVFIRLTAQSAARLGNPGR